MSFVLNCAPRGVLSLIRAPAFPALRRRRGRRSLGHSYCVSLITRSQASSQGADNSLASVILGSPSAFGLLLPEPQPATVEERQALP